MLFESSTKVSEGILFLGDTPNIIFHNPLLSSDTKIMIS